MVKNGHIRGHAKPSINSVPIEEKPLKWLPTTQTQQELRNTQCKFQMP